MNDIAPAATENRGVFDADQRTRAPRRRPSLRAHLVGLVLTVLIPALALGAAAAWQAARAYQDAAETRLRDTTRALALALDSEFETYLAAALALASSPALRLTPDVEVMALRSWTAELSTALGGARIVVNDAGPGHRQLLNTDVPEGAPMPAAFRPGEGAWDLLQRVAETARPAISDLFAGLPSGRPVAAVAAPVLVEGRVERVVVIALDPTRLSATLRQQDLQGGAFASVADGRGRIVARSRDHERFLGTVPPSLGTPEMAARSGIFRAPTSYGYEGLYARETLRRAPGWTVVVVEPLTTHRAAWLHPLLGLAVGGALALALGATAAALLARRVLTPIRALRRQAEGVALGLRRGNLGATEETPAGVAEFEALRLGIARADAALQAREAEFRASFEQSSAPMSQVDCATGRLLQVNAAYCTLLGRPADQLVGRPFSEFVHPEDREADLEGFRCMCRGEAPGHEVLKRYVRPDGSVRWVDLSSSPIRDATGRLVRTVAVAKDMTERRAAEAGLRESEERLRSAQSAARAVTWEWDLSKALVHWVDIEVARSLAGDDLDEITEFERWAARIHPEDRERHDREAAAAVEAGEGRIEFRILRGGNGRDVRWLEVSGRVVRRDASGKPTRMAGVTVDITARREAEAALRASESRLRLAVEAAELTTWEYDVRRDLATRGGALSVSFPGLPNAGFGLSAWLAPIHPDDRPGVESAFRAAAEGSSPRYHVTFRLQRLDGAGWRWIEAVGAPVEQDEATGRPLRLAGVSQDVTERKQGEQRQALLMRELDHRAKNLLAVVQAALRLTPKDNVADFVRAVEGRVGALARTHTLLAEARWEGAELRQLADGELAPFRTGAYIAEDAPAPRIDMHGVDVTLAPTAAQAVSMALHELATNATKHGALSAPTGRVSVSWEIDREADLMRLRWAETGGPRLDAPPDRRGFGSRVIEATLREQLGGRVERRWEATGLVCEIVLPLARILAGRSDNAGELQAATA